MTKKDYELIAQAFSKVKNKFNDLDYFKASYIVKLIEEELASELGLDNELFDYKKFFKACE